MQWCLGLSSVEPVVSYSFIIPVLNEAATIVDLLEQLARQYPSAEVIVVDGGSQDATAKLAAPLCDHILISEPGRALQMNTGAAVANGQYLLFLHADSRPSITEPQLQCLLQTNPLWGFCKVRLQGQEWAFRCISQAMNWRSQLTQVATGDQMLFVSAEQFEQCGGFDAIPLMEDVAITKRLRQRGRASVITEPIETSSRRWRERGIIRTVVQMWWLRLAYFAGASPQKLWRNYYGKS